MSGVELFIRDANEVAVPVSAANPLPTTGGGSSTDMTATNTLLGAVTETAPASDTASSGLNGRLQRVAQRLTSLIAQFPATLGAKAAAASLAVAWSTEDIARVGIVTETAPASDTASSGLNGRLQRIAQNLTTMQGLLQRTASVARLLSAAGTSGDATLVKNSAGVLYGVKGYNAANAVRFLKLYNSASAPTAGSGTPLLTLALPPNAAFGFDWFLGLTFSTGIGFTLTTAVADNSSASVTAADIVGLNVEYT